MVADPPLLGFVKSIYDYCKDLNDSFKKYKIHSEYLYDMAVSIDKYYRQISTTSQTTPEVVKKFYNNALKFKILVEQMPKKNIMYRMFFMKRNDDKMEALKDELDYIMQQFHVQNFVITDESNKYSREMLKQMYQLQDEVKNLRIEKNKDEEIKREISKKLERDYIEDTLNDDKKICNGLLSEDQQNTKPIDEFKKDELGCTVQTINMIQEQQFNPVIYNNANKLFGYMQRNSKIAQNISELPSWYIDEVNIEVENQNDFIGSGSYSYVQKANYNGAIVAKKVFDIQSREYQNMANANFKENMKDLYMREIEIWNRIKGHPFILQFYGASHISQHPFIISEYCSQGTVKSYINRDNININQKLQIMHDIAIGVYHLHNNRIIHGDLKSDNVLISNNGTPKICDFGLSVYLTNRPTTKEKLITSCHITEAVRWKAPELFSGYKSETVTGIEFNRSKNNVIGKISFYSDIFSLGRLFYEIISQQYPFYEILYNPDVENKVISGEFPSRVNPTNPNNEILCSDDMWNILLGTWKYDPFLRLPLLSIATLLDQLKTPNLSNEINNDMTYIQYPQSIPSISPIYESSNASNSYSTNHSTIINSPLQEPLSPTNNIDQANLPSFLNQHSYSLDQVSSLPFIKTSNPLNNADQTNLLSFLSSPNRSLSADNPNLFKNSNLLQRSTTNPIDTRSITSFKNRRPKRW